MISLWVSGWQKALVPSDTVILIHASYFNVTSKYILTFHLLEQLKVFLELYQ